MLKKVIILILSVLYFNVQGQELKVSFESNGQYYIDDDKIKLEVFENQHRFRSNSYLKADYSFKNFEFGFQAESYLPKALLNYNPLLQDFNLGTIFARYKSEKIDFTAGHLYEQFGSGLSLRFWEDRALGINNSLFGGRIKANFDVLQIKILAGKQRVGMGFDFSKSLICGADAEFDISSFMGEDYSLKLGASLSSRIQNPDSSIENIDKFTHIFGGRADFQTTTFNISGEYLHKTKDVHFEQQQFFNETQRTGSALLLNLGYNPESIAISVNLRRLENFSFSSQRDLVDNLYNSAMINYLPALTKPYEHSLQNIYVYQSQPKLVYLDDLKKQGEVGGQFDIFFQVEEGSFLGGKSGASFAINGSYWSGLQNDITRIKSFDKYGNPTEKILLETSFLGSGEPYYKDLGIEYRKTFSQKCSSIFSYLYQFYDANYMIGEPYKINSHTILGEATYFLSQMKSLRFELQHQWAWEYFKNWIAGVIEFVPNEKFSFFVSDMYNYGNENAKKRIHYYNVGASFVKGATRFSLGYGRQRGGAVCVGGICRYLPESAGLSFSINTQF